LSAASWPRNDALPLPFELVLVPVLVLLLLLVVVLLLLLLPPLVLTLSWALSRSKKTKGGKVVPWKGSARRAARPGASWSLPP
jgi:hypothetical protein